MRVLVIDVTGLFGGEDLDIAEDLPTSAIDTHCMKGAALVESRRHPDLIATDNRRRPAPAGDLTLPGDVLGLAPVERQLCAVRMIVAARPTELRPLAADDNRAILLGIDLL